MAAPPSTHELEDLAAAATALSVALRRALVVPDDLAAVTVAIYELNLRIRIVTRWAEAFIGEIDRAIVRAKQNTLEN